jgi:hypothetical protein
MSAPAFLASDFRYLLLTGVTDVATIISALNAELVTNGAWTDRGGNGVGPFRSPSRAYDSSWMQIALTRDSATRLSWVCTDHKSAQINNQTSTKQDIDSAGSAVHILTGPDIVMVDVARSTPECFYLARLNDYPDVNVESSFVCSIGPRNNSGALAYQTLQDAYGHDVGRTSYGTYQNMLLRAINQTTVTPRTWLGDYMYYPLEFVGSYATNMLSGTVPHVVICPSALSYGTQVTIKIDTNTTAAFRVCGITAVSYRRLAMRIS